MSKHLNHGTVTRGDSASGESWLSIQTARRRQDLLYVVEQARILSLALRHPGVPWYAKLVAGCSIGYLVSPIQIIPTFIPVIGQLDDLFVLFVGMKLLRKLAPQSALAECEARAKSSIFFHHKLVGPAPLPKQIGSPAA